MSENKSLSMGEAVMNTATITPPAQQPAAVDQPANQLEKWKSYRVTPSTITADSSYLAEVCGTPFFARGEITIFRGRDKSGKSSVLRDFICSMFAGDSICRLTAPSIRVGVFDMEMAARDSKKYYNQLPANTYDWESDAAPLQIFALSELPAVEQWQAVQELSEACNFDLIVVDTIGDMVADMNDAENATKAILNFLAWVRKNNIAAAVVLHVNKSDTNAQGHWGYQLQKKCHDSILVEMQNDYDHQTITHTHCREYHLPKLICTQSPDGSRKYEREIDYKTRLTTSDGDGSKKRK